MERRIEIIDNNTPRYELIPETTVLGRRYDNDSEQLVVAFPQFEIDNGSKCVMIVTNGFEVVDHIEIENEVPTNIKDTLSKYLKVRIGFSFIKEDGYVKNSEARDFEFLPAQKPDGFVATEPELKKKYDLLYDDAFTWAELDGNTLVFKNLDGIIVRQFDLSPFVQAQSDLGEIDETSETFVKGKETRNLLNNGEDGTSPYATQAWIMDNGVGGRINEVEFNGKIAPIVDKTAVITATADDVGALPNTTKIPSKTSDLTNDSGFTTNLVSDLINYYLKDDTYSKQEVLDLVGSIKTISMLIVDSLPDVGETNVIYLVTAEQPNTNNIYNEFVYIGGSWEQIGSTAIDLTDYVKFTDYATDLNQGTVRGSGRRHGTFIYQGEVRVSPASETEIINKSNTANPISPKNIDLVTKLGITTNTIELTNEEQTTAKSWIGVNPEIKTALDTNLTDNVSYDLTASVITSLTLTSPETITNNFNCDLSFKTGETITLTAGGIKFRGRDCLADYSFDIQPNTNYYINFMAFAGELIGIVASI